MNTVKDGGGQMVNDIRLQALKTGKDAQTLPLDSGVDSGLSYRSQNSNNSINSQCSNNSFSGASTQCARASEFSDQSSLNFTTIHLRESEFSDSGRESTGSGRQSSRRSSDVTSIGRHCEIGDGFGQNYHIDVPVYYSNYAHVIKLANSFFTPNWEVTLVDHETHETLTHLTPVASPQADKFSHTFKIRQYHSKLPGTYFMDGFNPYGSGVVFYQVKQNYPDRTSYTANERLHATMGDLIQYEKVEKANEKRAIDQRHEMEIASLRLEDLKRRKLKVLGKGGYAHVVLVESYKNKFYALKCIDKNSVEAAGQRRHVKAEREILMQVNSKFILKLYRTFRDANYVYLLTEVLLGGELFTLMKRNGPFKTKPAKFAVACVLEAIGYLHSRNIVHRDIKPENMLVDTLGYVKLADFGFAKKLGPDGRTRTFCGTPGYLAPEVYRKRAHGYAADYWSIGVFLFELLSNKSPFRRTTDEDTKRMTIRGIDAIQFPRDIDSNAADMIKGLCTADPTERLGKDGIDELRTHPWLSSFNFNQLYDPNFESPLKPDLSGRIDTSQFDDFSMKSMMLSSSDASISDNQSCSLPDGTWDADF